MGRLTGRFQRPQGDSRKGPSQFRFKVMFSCSWCECSLYVVCMLYVTEILHACTSSMRGMHILHKYLIHRMNYGCGTHVVCMWYV